METQKNINLKVIGYDKELRQFKVEFADKEHWVRQTGQELPDYWKCRIVESNGEFEITPEVENYFHAGAIRRFTVKSDMTDSAGVYELIDESWFVVYLYGAENLKFFKELFMTYLFNLLYMPLRSMPISLSLSSFTFTA